MTYKFKEHTADVKFIAEGKSLEDAFMECANALKEALCGDVRVSRKLSKKVSITGTDLENLLYKFLEEILFLLDSENFLVSSVKFLKINGMSLVAELIGDSSQNYSIIGPVKAVTYSQMSIKFKQNKFFCTVVLDV